MNTTEILQGLKKDPNDYCSQTKARAWNAALDSAIAAMNTTDLVKALEGLKKPHADPRLPYLQNVERIDGWNAAIDRAIELLETHGKK